MKKFFRYMSYLLRHKYFVAKECFKNRLYWQGIIHDLSKFRRDEFVPYMNYFYDHKDEINRGRDESGYYKPTDTGDKAFDFAWLLHQKRNKHHWQWWILPEDNGGVKVLEMPYKYMLEMLCDWKGAGMAQGNKYAGGVEAWYWRNRDKMQLHPNTRAYIEQIIRWL